MSLLKQKSLIFELQTEMPNNNQLYAKYDIGTNTIVLDCSEGLIWYLKSETIQQLNNCFNVKIINTYKNMNKPIIYCNCIWFGNKVSISDKNQNYLFGNNDDYKFPLFMGGIPHLNHQNNKYVEQTFYFDYVDNNNVCITTIKNAY